MSYRLGVANLSSKLLATSPLVAGATMLAVASTFGDDEGPVLCLFRRCTGGYCPGCGGSRAMAALLRGDIATAWGKHPWIPLIVAQLVMIGLLALAGWRSRLPASVVPLLTVNMAFGVGLWIFRLTDGSIPVPFA